MGQTAAKSRSRWRAFIVVAAAIAASLIVGAAGAVAQGPAYDQYRLANPGASPGAARADAEARRRADAIAAASRANATAADSSAEPGSASVVPPRRSAIAIFADALWSPVGAVLGLTLVLLVAAGARYRGRRSTGLRALSGMVIAGTLAVAGCGGGNGSSSGPPPDSEFFGVQPRAAPTAEDFKRMADANVGTFRVFINWSTIQPTEDALYDWRELDDVFTRLAFYDIQPLPYIAGVPNWLTGDVHDSPVGSRDVRQGLKAFVSAAALRYGPASEFWAGLSASDLEIEPKPPRAWEIWNEQNSAFFWRPRPSPREYARLLKIAAAEIREADPAAQIIVGGMFGTPPEPASINAWTFARRLLKDPSIRSLVDFVGVHPYAPEISGVRFQLEKMRSALNQVGAKSAPLWVTEIGWGSSTGGGLKKGSQGQADLLREAFALFESQRDRLAIEGAVWFTWRDVEGLPGRRTFNATSGLLTSGGEEKPAFQSYAEATGGS